MRGLLLVILLALLAGGCSLLSEFNPDKMREDSEVACSDKEDNDGNGLADCADETCRIFSFCREDSDARCSDGNDNDVDGLVDCADTDCCSSASCYLTKTCGEKSKEACSDKKDNDEDGLIDCADFSCMDNAHCCVEPLPLVQETFSTGNATCVTPDCYLLKDACCTMKHTPCNSFDTSRWISWGVPRPRLSGGSFSPNQPCSSCQASGLVSTLEVSLSAGLHLEFEADLRGYSAAEVSVGLVDQAFFPQFDTLCGGVSSPYRLRVGIQLSGGKVEAILQSAVRASVNGKKSGKERYSFQVESDGTVTFNLGQGQTYQTGIKVTGHQQNVRLLIQGFSAEAVVDNVFLARRTGCRDLAAWVAGPTGNGPVFSPADEEKKFDGFSVADPSVLWDGSFYRLYYTGRTSFSTGSLLGLASSTDGVAWKRHGSALVVGGESAAMLSEPSVMMGQSGSFTMAYRGVDSGGAPFIAVATSKDGVSWKREGIAATPGPAGSWDDGDVASPMLVSFSGPKDTAARLYLWYTGKRQGSPIPSMGLAVQQGSAGYSFTKESQNPVLVPQSGAHDSRGVAEPWVLVESGVLHLWYAGLSWGDLSRISYAISEDGKRWVRYPSNPVVQDMLYGASKLRGPSVVKRWGTLEMWYGGAAPTARPSIGYAINAVSPPLP